MKFSGTDTYVATEDLMVAVNAAVSLERPLLVKGEPGTGKTMLAEEVAKALERDLLRWHIKSTTKAQQGLYEYDAVARLRDGQLGEERATSIANYISKGMLWQAFESDKKHTNDHYALILPQFGGGVEVNFLPRTEEVREKVRRATGFAMSTDSQSQ